MRVSICIPTHEAGGHGHEYLNELLGTIKGQSYQDFEVIVSDHSKNNDIMTVCEAYSDAIEIRYVRNFYGRGRISPNINVALSIASGVTWIATRILPEAPDILPSVNNATLNPKS